jgi:hypothetical protein
MRIESLSSRIEPQLCRPGLRATVASTYAEACNLVSEEGVVFSLVSQEIGDGPLNAVVSENKVLALMQPNNQITGNGTWLHLGPGWRLDLSSATIWDPCPDCSQFSRWPQVVRTNLAWLRSAVPLNAPQESLAAHPAFPVRGAFGAPQTAGLANVQAARLIQGLLRAYQQGDVRWIKVFARRLSGLGPGLTPAGDDWMAGWLVGLRIRLMVDDEFEPPLPTHMVAETVIRAAHGRTNLLSLAFLQAAADCAVPRSWHDLLGSLVNADPTPVRQATAEVMRYGATSGSDMLAGFLTALESP